MKLSGILLLILAFLLNGCFSGKEHSDGLNTSELLKMEEERQMKELSRTGTLRLGVSAKNQKNIAALQKKLESKGWKVQVIVCPEKRLTGLLRSGAVDLIFPENVSEESAATFGFYYLNHGVLIKNKRLYETFSPVN